MSHGPTYDRLSELDMRADQIIESTPLSQMPQAIHLLLRDAYAHGKVDGQAEGDQRKRRRVMCTACKRSSVVLWETNHYEASCPKCHEVGTIRVGPFTREPLDA